MGRVTNQVFSESEEWDIDTVSETIVSEYKKATDFSLNKKNKVKKVELFTDHYKVEGNFYVGLEKNNLDYENHKEANNQYIAYSENKTVKMTYTLSNNTITKISLS